MSGCNANFLLVSENTIVNDSSEKTNQILKDAINGKFSMSLIIDYAYYLIPTMIPIIGVFIIPIIVYLFVNRFKFEVSKNTNILVFLLFNSFIIASTCFAFVYSYNIILGLKNSVCDIKRIAIEILYNFLDVLESLSSSECTNFSFDLKSITDEILEIAETVDSYINIYYSLAMVIFQVLLVPVLLFTSIFFEKCKRKICFYSFFTIIVTFAWLLGCLFLPTTFMASNIQSLSNNIFSNPSYYIGDNCIIESNSIPITPCNMLVQCDKNSSRNLLIGFLNGSDTDTYDSALKKIVSGSGNDNTDEQNDYIYSILSNQTRVNTIEGITTEGESAPVEDVVDLLQNFRKNADLYVAQDDVNATQKYIDNILEDLDKTGTITNKEFDNIANNHTNIPDKFKNRTFEEIITIDYSNTNRRRLVESGIGDTSNVVCAGKILSSLKDIVIPCSSITQIKKIRFSILSNSSLLYFIFTSITCVLSFSILPFFTEPGKGRPIKLPQLKYIIK